ncbi:unnamed protein product [Rhizophagus irregularis]|nr:unnamed protein product [Rhizophagus irregularis]
MKELYKQKNQIRSKRDYSESISNSSEEEVYVNDETHKILKKKIGNDSKGLQESRSDYSESISNSSEEEVYVDDEIHKILKKKIGNDSKGLQESMEDDLYFISEHILYFGLDFNEAFILILTNTCKYKRTFNDYHYHKNRV